MKPNIVRVTKENYHLYDDTVYWRINKKERTIKEKELCKNTLSPPAEIQNDHLYVYVVEYDNKFVAWLSMIFIPKVGLVNRKGYVYVEELWVEPSYRRMGFAKLLMKEADDYSDKINATGIRLGVNVENPSAIKLYEYCGYKSTGQAFTMEKTTRLFGGIMGYIENKRKYLGTQPIIMVGANVIIENEQGQILLHHRTDKDWWGLPGGAMELGESLEDTAKREVYEEINLKCLKLTLFNQYSGPELYYKYPDGNEVYNVTTSYICKDYSGDIIVEKTEGRAAKFFDLKDIPNNLSDPIRMILKDYIAYRTQ